MARGRPVSIVFYAINGRGLGHLTRLTAIARAARQLLEALDVASELEIVTTSEGASIAEDFPVYKLPSKTAIARAGAARERYVQRAKLLVSNLVAAQSPDLLVLDTVPYGAFQELAFLRSYARATAYVYRHQDEKVAASDLVQRHLELFDRIVVPGNQEDAASYPVPRGAHSKLRFVGPVHAFDEAAAWDRDRVRAYFDVEPGRRVVYVSGGGGGDGRIELERLARAVAEDRRNTVLVGYGPLHRGECLYGRNVIPLLEGNVSRFFRGVDAAVSAGGYNTYEELLAARVPALFYAQAKGLDRQDVRIEAGVARGWHGALPEHAPPELVRGRVEELLDGEAGARVRVALAQRDPGNGALRAAVELLLTCAGLDGSALDAGALLEVASWRRDDVPVSKAAFVDDARSYLAWRHLAAPAPERAGERDAAIARWWTNAPSDARPLAVAAELRALRARSGADDETWRALLQAFAGQPSRSSHREKLDELLDALRTLGPAAVELARANPGRALRDVIRDLVREREAEPAH